MDLILLALEFTNDCMEFVGIPSVKLSVTGIALATIYIQWTTSELEKLLGSPLQKQHPSKPHRIDVRFMHYMENVIQILSFLQTIKETETLMYSSHDDEASKFTLGSDSSSSCEDAMVAK